MLGVVTEGSAFRSRADPLQSRPGLRAWAPALPASPAAPWEALTVI